MARSTVIVTLYKGTAEGKAAENPKQSETFIYGPTEHGYLSADVPVNTTKQLKYDAGTGRIVQASTPSSFYIGLNYKFGDIYTRYYNRSDFWNGFSAKFLVQASSTPFASYGLGLAYQFKWFDVFVARVNTAPAANVAGGGRTLSTIYGVSFNSTHAANWISGGK